MDHTFSPRSGKFSSETEKDDLSAVQVHCLHCPSWPCCTSILQAMNGHLETLGLPLSCGGCFCSPTAPSSCLGGSESSLDYPLHYHFKPEPGEEKGSLYRG